VNCISSPELPTTSGSSKASDLELTESAEGGWQITLAEFRLKLQGKGVK